MLEESDLGEAGLPRNGADRSERNCNFWEGEKFKQ